jgi:hypothetical protein
MKHDQQVLLDQRKWAEQLLHPLLRCLAQGFAISEPSFPTRVQEGEQGSVQRQGCVVGNSCAIACDCLWLCWLRLCCVDGGAGVHSSQFEHDPSAGTAACFVLPLPCDFAAQLAVAAAVWGPWFAALLVRKVVL